MNVKEWIDLKTDNKRIMAGLFMLVVSAGGVIGYLAVEIKNLNEEKLAIQKEASERVEKAQLEKLEAIMDGNKALLEVIKQHSAEQKSDNEKLEKINEERTKSLIEQKKNSENLEHNVRKLNRVLDKK